MRAFLRHVKEVDGGPVRAWLPSGAMCYLPKYSPSSQKPSLPCSNSACQT